MPAPRDTVALVGSESLLGRELRDVCATAEPRVHLRLIAAQEEEAGVLTEQEGEPAIVGRLRAGSLEDARAAFLAGSAEAARQALGFGLQTILIDLTGAAEDHPKARLRAPMVEPSGCRPPEGSVHVIAHPAAIALAMVLGRVHARYPVRRAVAHVFEPASEHGRRGLTELQEQTVNLLSFKGLPKAVFDSQLAFNLLARYGEEAPAPLESFELRIERHLASLLANAGGAPMPSLRLIQAPVFHGHSFSLWLELENNPGVEEMERWLGAD